MRRRDRVPPTRAAGRRDGIGAAFRAVDGARGHPARGGGLRRRHQRFERHRHGIAARVAVLRGRGERPRHDRVERQGTSGRTSRGDGATAPTRARASCADVSPCHGRRPVERLVQHEAEPVDVGRRGRGRALRLLGAEVLDRAERRAGHGSLGIGREPRDPEVGDHRAAVAGKQDVARLHVPVDDATEVRGAKPAGDVEPDPGDVTGEQRPVTPDPRREVLALDELHDHERPGRVGARVETADDVPVSQDGGRERLPPEPVGEVGVGADLGPQELERHRPLEAGVLRAVDGRHAAAADHLAQPIPTREEAAGHPGGGVRRIGSCGHAPDDRPDRPNGPPRRLR